MFYVWGMAMVHIPCELCGREIRVPVPLSSEQRCIDCGGPHAQFYLVRYKWPLTNDEADECNEERLWGP